MYIFIYIYRYLHVGTCTVLLYIYLFVPVLLVDVCLLDPLVLGSSVLEPDLDLGLTQAQSLGQLTPPTS